MSLDAFGLPLREICPTYQHLMHPVPEPDDWGALLLLPFLFAIALQQNPSHLPPAKSGLELGALGIHRHGTTLQDFKWRMNNPRDVQLTIGLLVLISNPFQKISQTPRLSMDEFFRRMI